MAEGALRPVVRPAAAASFHLGGEAHQSAGCPQNPVCSATGVPSGRSHLVLVDAELVGVIDFFGGDASCSLAIHCVALTGGSSGFFGVVIAVELLILQIPKILQVSKRGSMT